MGWGLAANAAGPRFFVPTAHWDRQNTHSVSRTHPTEYTMSVTIRTARPFEVDLGPLDPALAGVIATLRPMTAQSFSRYQSLVTEPERFGETVVATVMEHLDSIAGMTVQEADGTETPFSAIREAHVASLEMSVLVWLCNRLAQRATLPDIVRKN